MFSVNNNTMKKSIILLVLMVRVFFTLPHINGICSGVKIKEVKSQCCENWVIIKSDYNHEVYSIPKSWVFGEKQIDVKELDK